MVYRTYGTGYVINADGTRRDLTPEENARDHKILRRALDQCKQPQGIKMHVAPDILWGAENLADKARTIVGSAVKIIPMKDY